MEDIFCKIIRNLESKDVVLQDENWLAINDIRPQAPVHILIMPKRHILNLTEVNENTDKELLGELVIAAKKVAEKLNLAYNGFRLIINQGSDAGQVVPHLHIHLLAGKKLGSKIVA